jgi:hypothetical protein
MWTGISEASLSNNNAPLLWLLLLLLEVKPEIQSQVRRKSIGDE